MKKMLQLSLQAVAGIALVLSGPVLADKDGPKLGAIEERDVIAGKVGLDARNGYILVTGMTRSVGAFLRVPDEVSRAAYQKDWEEAFAKAQKKYASALSSWESQVKAVAGTQSKAPLKPEEPTRETFRIEPLELRDLGAFGPMFVYAKGGITGEESFTYLTAIKPGTYIYYGPVMVVPGGGAAGMCNCMGSVKFEVKAGVVTDLGNSLSVLPQGQTPFDVATLRAMDRVKVKEAKSGKPAKMVPTPPLAYGLPASLKDWPSIRAEFSASGKVNNYFGVTVTRMYPIPGVLEYKRDQIVDARTGNEVASPTIFTQGRIKK